MRGFLNAGENQDFTAKQRKRRAMETEARGGTGEIDPWSGVAWDESSSGMTGVVEALNDPVADTTRLALASRAP